MQRNYQMGHKKNALQRRVEALTSLPLPYCTSQGGETIISRRGYWKVLPDCLIPLLRNDLHLSANTLHMMCSADPEHADYDAGQWSVDPYDGDNNTSLVLISSCINEDLEQSLGELALRVAYIRQLPFLEVARHLTELRDRHILGYFAETPNGEIYFRLWTPDETKNRLPDPAGAAKALRSLLTQAERGVVVPFHLAYSARRATAAQ